jgi:sirohydrochlorin ferrochelatase
MKSLLLVAHGSRRAASNDEVRALTERLARQAGGRYGHVACAFLELAEPSIPDGIQGCIDAGADEVVVLPYFLSAGRHVAEDIPGEVKIKQEQYPQLRIHIAPYLGLSDAIPDLLLQAAG